MSRSYLYQRETSNEVWNEISVFLTGEKVSKAVVSAALIYYDIPVPVRLSVRKTVSVYRGTKRQEKRDSSFLSCYSELHCCYLRTLDGFRVHSSAESAMLG